MIMKKIMSLIIAIMLIFPLISCSKTSIDEHDDNDLASENNNQKSAVASAFSFDFETDENVIKYYTENDTYEMLQSASPYYLGAQQLNISGFQEFYNLKSAKVTEAQKITKELLIIADNLKTDLEPFKAAYINFMEILIAEDKLISEFAEESGLAMANYLVKIEGIKAIIESLDTGEIDNDYARSGFEYEKTVLTAEMSDLVYRDFSYLLSAGATLVSIFENTENNHIKNALKDFEEEMAQIENLNENITKLTSKSIELDTALKQINTGEYYMAKASIAFIQEQLPLIKAEAQKLEANEDALDEESIELINDYLIIIEEFTEIIANKTNALDTSSLLISHNDQQQSDYNYFIQKAQASTILSANEMTDQSFQSMRTIANSTTSNLKSLGRGIYNAGSYTWSGIKKTAQATQTTIGVGLDTASAMTKSGFDILHGSLEGNTLGEITTEIKGNFIRIKENYDRDMSGSEVLKDAGAFLEGLEDIPTNVLEQTIGKGWTSWGVGGIGKMTVGMFTGFGKGIYKLANKQSTAGEIAEGMLDVGLSLIGGSKTIFQGAANNGKSGIKLVGEKALNYLKIMANKVKKGEIKKLTAEILKKSKLSQGEVLELITNSLKLEGKQAIAAKLQAINASLNQKFGTLLKEGMKGILKNIKNAPGTMKSNYATFVKKQFEHSLAGYKNALIETLGHGAKDYVDNLLTAKMDEWIKSAVKLYIDAGKYDGEYIGEIKSDFENIPIKIIVEDGELSGQIDYNQSNNNGIIILKMQYLGSVDENGIVSGSVESTSIMKGDIKVDGETVGKIDVQGTISDGVITGKIQDDEMSITIKGTENISGTIMNEDNSRSGPMKPMDIVLVKQEK